MKLSLIGMSGSGKSYWSKKLEAHGFKRFSCDDVIQKKLQKLLRELQFSSIKDVATWMGQPYEPHYKSASEQYLQFEKEAMEEIFIKLDQLQKTKNVVIDTTGSIIYLDKKITEKIKKYTHVIYLETPQSVQDEMFQVFLRDPKPIIWGDVFTKINDEKEHDAIKRLYPKLLSYRTKQYEKFASQRFDYSLLRLPEFTTEMFLHIVNV
jgi:shikimate kinase